MRSAEAVIAKWWALLLLVAACSADEAGNGPLSPMDGGASDGTADLDARQDLSISDAPAVDLTAVDRTMVDAPGLDAFVDSNDAARDAPAGGSETGGDGRPSLDDAERDGPPSSDAAPPPIDAGTDAGATVVPEDTILVPPVPRGTVLGTITGYELSSGCPMSKPEYCEAPIYSSYDRNTAEWWDVLVDEHLLSRVNVVMAHGRGCFDPNSGLDGNGNMCPRHLSKLVAAVDRAGASGVYRLGMWDDTGAYQGARNHVDKLPDGTLFDLADRNTWRFFWDYNMKIWFETIPSRLWFRIDGRPVIAFWSLASAFFSHQQGNASLLLRDLRAKFQARYGENPLFILDETWSKLDTSITVDDGQGMNAWFVPPGNNYTYRNWNGSSWGAMVPGFRDSENTPGCGSGCREVARRDGQALRDALSAGLTAKFSLLEGWTDIYESAGYYRSSSWRMPNLYINVVRESADPTPETLRFQAEAADAFSTPIVAADAGARLYRNDVGNIGKLNDGTGWYVDWTGASGWLEYREVTLGCGTYRMTARVAVDAQRTIHLELDGTSLGAVTVPPAGGLASYQLVHLGSVKLAAGKHVLRLVADSAGVNADWFFVRRAAGCNESFR